MLNTCGTPVCKPRTSPEKKAFKSTLITVDVVISRCCCEILHKLVTHYGLFLHNLTHRCFTTTLSWVGRLYTLTTSTITTTVIYLKELSNNLIRFRSFTVKHF